MCAGSKSYAKTRHEVLRRSAQRCSVASQTPNKLILVTPFSGIFDVKTRKTAPTFRATQQNVVQMFLDRPRDAYIPLVFSPLRHSVPTSARLHMGTPGSRLRAKEENFQQYTLPFGGLVPTKLLPSVRAVGACPRQI